VADYSQQVGPNTPTPLPEPSETINLRNYHPSVPKKKSHTLDFLEKLSQAVREKAGVKTRTGAFERDNIQLNRRSGT
jgi:hypothetical protein